MVLIFFRLMVNNFMKILFFITTLGGGGAERVLVDIAKNFDKEKYKITVLSLFNEGIYNNLIKDVVEYKYCFNKFSDNLKIRRWENWFIFGLLRLCPAELLHKIFIRDSYDIEVAFLEGLSTKIISGTNKAKKLAWVHCDLINLPWSTRAYLNIRKEIKAYESFDKIICVSNLAKLAFEEKFGLKAQVQYNVLNDTEIISRSLDAFEEIRNSDQFKIISVGRLTPPKAYDRLLRVHKRLINDGFDYKLYILGEGKEQAVLEKYISDNGLFDSVELLGFKNNPYNYMKWADLFVCSSVAEGFSTVATEAIILGLPIVTTSCAGMEDLLGDSEFGLITENSEEGLYRGLHKILKDRELYNYYKQKAKERGTSFKMNIRLKEYEKIFDDLKCESQRSPSL